MSISLGFNTAVRALITQQQALNTTAHNIANANTPGFSREDVVLETTDPFTFPSENRSALAGQIGTGYFRKPASNVITTFAKATADKRVAG